MSIGEQNSHGAVDAFWSQLGAGHARFLRDLIDLLPVSGFIKDRDSVFVHVNTEFEHRLGGDLDPLGRRDSDFVSGELAAGFVAADRQVMEDGKPLIDFIDTQLRNDGTTSAYSTSKLPIARDDGYVIGLVAFTTEVPDAEQVGAELRTSERRYALAARASRDGIWDLDLALNEVTLSPRCCQLLELPVIAGSYRWDVVSERLGDVESARVLDALRPLRAAPSGTAEHTIELPLRDGTTRWLHLVGTAMVVGGAATRLVGSIADVTAERQREEDLRRQANRDELTGLTNRRYLMERLRRHADEGEPCSLIALDLDRFKVINDSLGHQAGDRMLLTVAARLERLLHPGETLSRLGGDEFAILVPGADPARALGLAAETVDSLGRVVRIDGLDVSSSASVGVARCSEGQSAASMLRNADIALYQAKDDGKSCVRLYSPDMGERADHELELQIRLRRAVANDEFRLHYQTIHFGNGHAVAGVEALLRWYPPEREPEPPARFLDYLERTGLIIDVGQWVIDESCRQLAEWQREYPQMGGTHLAINLSRVQFRQPTLVEDILDAIGRNGLEPSQIVIEVTETAVSEDPAAMLDALERLRAKGVRIAVDDFGVGQSSLSVLYDLPVDIVKIDRSFTSRFETGDGELLIDAILRIADSLDLDCIAEGVESAAQDAWLRAHGCRYVQGWLMSKAMPPEQVPMMYGVGLADAA